MVITATRQNFEEMWTNPRTQPDRSSKSVWATCNPREQTRPLGRAVEGRGAVEEAEGVRSSRTSLAEKLLLSPGVRGVNQEGGRKTSTDTHAIIPPLAAPGNQPTYVTVILR